MDANGNVVGQPVERTVRSFDRMITYLPKHLELQRRIKAGEKGLDFELFVSEHNLQLIKGSAAVRKAKSFTDLTPEQQKQVAQIVLDEKVLSLVQKVIKDQTALAKVTPQLTSLLEAGQLPSKLVLLDFWRVLAFAAEKDSNPTLLKRCAAGLRSAYPDRKDVMDWADKLDERAKALAK